MVSTSDNTTHTLVPEKIDTTHVLQNLFALLNPKEKEILVRRFSLEGNARETLESIGQSFHVTRERIRQIEALALSKLNRTMQSNGLKTIMQIAEDILRSHGGIMREDMLIAEMVNTLYGEKSSDLDSSLMYLSLAVTKNIVYQNKSDKTKSYYRFNTIHKDEIDRTCDIIYNVLNNQTEVIDWEKIISEVQKTLAKKYTLKPALFIKACIEIDQRILKTDKGYGLSSWRHIRPRNLRDKAYIVLRDAGHPMHFTEIANAILERRFDTKMVTVQAVHNELIRNDKFVLIGRGKYALAEWWYTEGTVSDVIEQILSKHGRPMTKREIVETVLSMRTVQEATVSLNLQKNPHFVRVGRALYTLDLSKKQ